MLTVEREPSYLSPSSLVQFEKNPNRFYLERMAPNRIEKEPQSPAGGAGSAFDVLIKTALAERLDNLAVVKQRILDDLYNPEDKNKYRDVPFKEMFYEISVEEQNRELVRSTAEKLCALYKSSVFYKDTPFTDIEIHRHFNVLNSGVPIFMKLDAVVNYGSYEPFDWKVQGYGSASGASPKPGYKMIQDESGNLLGCHKDYRTDISIHSIDERWGDQLTTYGWGLGHPPLTPFKVYVDALIIRPTGVRIARYEGWVTLEAQKNLLRRYEHAWAMIKSGEFLKTLCSERKIVEQLASEERWYR